MNLFEQFEVLPQDEKQEFIDKLLNSLDFELLALSCLFHDGFYDYFYENDFDNDDTSDDKPEQS